MNKTLALVKNLVIATVATAATGMGASELASKVTDDGKIIGAISTVSEYLVSFATFTTLHGINNRDIYSKNGKFNYWQCIKDSLKFMVSFIPLDVCYVSGRPFVQDYFIRNGLIPIKSSLAADSVFVSAYAIAAYPLARLTGILRSKKRKFEKDLE